MSSPPSLPTTLPTTVAGYIGASDHVAEQFLTQIYPILAAAASPALYYAAIWYWALLGYQIYAGLAPLQPRDVLAKVVVTCAVFGSLSWVGFATQIYHFFVSFMEGTAQMIMVGDSATSLLDGLLINGDQVSQTLMNNSLVQINAIIEGTLILVLNSLLFTISLVVLTLSKFGLAVTMALLPVFVGFLFFSETRHWFRNWLSKMLTFSLIYILVIAIIKLAFSAFGSYIDEIKLAAAQFETSRITRDMVTNLIIVELVLIGFILQVKGWASSLALGAATQGSALILMAANAVRTTNAREGGGRAK